jgi:hypothetical protein
LHTLDLVSARYRQSENSSGLLPRWFAVQGWLLSRALLVSDFIRTEGHHDTGSGQLRAEFIPITSVLSSIYGLLPRWFAVRLQSRSLLVSDVISTEGHHDTGSGQLRAEFIRITSVLSSIYVQSRSDILCRLRCDIESSIIGCL